MTALKPLFAYKALRLGLDKRSCTVEALSKSSFRVSMGYLPNNMGGKSAKSTSLRQNFKS